VLTSEKPPWNSWSKLQRVMLKKICQGLAVEVFYIVGKNSKVGTLREKTASFLHLWLRRASLIPKASFVIERIKSLKPLFAFLLRHQTDSVSRSGDKLIWAGAEDYAFMASKTVSCINFCLETNPSITHFLRTNNSSIWDFRKLMELLNDLPSQNLYAGIVGNFGRVNFASGAGILMDRGVAEALVANSSDLELQFVDDVTFGKLLHEKLRIPITPLNRQDAPFNDEASPDAYHFRCKEGTTTEHNLKTIGESVVKRHLA
jgi:hypothetical protein